MALLPLCNGVPRLWAVRSRVEGPLRKPPLVFLVDGRGCIFERLGGVRAAGPVEVIKAKVDS